MAVKDIRSNLQLTVANAAAVTGDGTSNGVAIDTADFELGLMLSVAASNYTDGTYNFVLQESVDAAFTVPVAIVDGSDKLIGLLADLTLTAASAAASVLNTIGVISNLQFIRLNVVATSVSTGADVTVVATEKAELMKVT